MLTLDNITTADAYTERSTLGPVPTAESIAIVVANASVFAQIAATDAAGTIQGWGPELLLTPQSTVLTRAQGVRFRSAVAGVPAQVVAQLFEPRDPLLSGGNAFTSTLSPGGGITPVGAGALQLIQDQLLVGPAATFEFLTIAPTFTHLMMIAQLRGDTAGTSTQCSLRFNGDSGANYDRQYVSGIDAVTGAVSVFAQTQIFLADIAVAGAPAGAAGHLDAIIPGYAGTTFHKQIRSSGGVRYNVANMDEILVSGNWRSLVAINRITLFPAAGNFIAGSRASLYGIT